MIQCPNCYAQNADGSTSCYNCRSPLAPTGAPAYYAQPGGAAVAAAAPSTSIMAILSLVFSLLGLLFILPIIGSIVGAILGHMATREIRQKAGLVAGEGLARAGVIISYVGLVLWGLCCVGYIVLLILGVGLSAFTGSA
jgi:hypothetical protein